MATTNKDFLSTKRLTMRSRMVVANWKMHTNLQEGIHLVNELVQMLHACAPHIAQVVLLPPFVHIHAIAQLLATVEGFSIAVGAQNCHKYTSGAFTGEIAAPMLRSVGADYVLLGHSERRKYFNEDSRCLAEKVTVALSHGLRPIVCCGEHEPTAGVSSREQFVIKQLSDSLFHLAAAQMKQIVIAYEPVWAIGTGHTPVPRQVQAMHRFIRRSVAHRYGEQLAQSILILYGGSCNAINAHHFFACPDVDGGLIGKASLEATSLVGILNALV